MTYDNPLAGKPLRYLIGADVSQWPLVEVDVPMSDTWRVAKSLEHWRDQVNAFAPDRDKSSDGTIGNEAHQATHSEHNPDENGVVRAMDISHDPFHGVDTYQIADQLLASHDNRIRYVISNSRIGGGEEYAKANKLPAWTWGYYGGGGKNAHDHHVHMSVIDDEARYDDVSDWAVHKTEVGVGQPITADYTKVKKGSIGAQVAEVQRILGITVDETFGEATRLAVVAFQLAHGLQADGIVGRQTWDVLRSGKSAPAVSWSYSSKGSWYSQFDGKYHWHDSGDAPGSAALEVPDDAQGVAMPSHATLGKWFEVLFPNGHTSIEQQTDLGPAVFTGRTIDISAAAAERAGYSPDDLHLPNAYPTDAIVRWRPIDAPPEVAGLTPQQQAVKYRDLRGSIVRKPDTPPTPVPVPIPIPAPHVPTVAELFSQIDAIAEVLRKLADSLDGIRTTLTEKNMASPPQTQIDWGAILQPIVKAIMPELMKVLPQILPQLLPALLPLIMNLLSGRAPAAAVQAAPPSSSMPTGSGLGIAGILTAVLGGLFQYKGWISPDMGTGMAATGLGLAGGGGVQMAKATFDKSKQGTGS